MTVAKKPIIARAKTPPIKKKRISIALQGGGSHGAYTWGVLDAILEDGRVEIEGISGTSAGGLNATAAIQGLIKGGNEKARESLKNLWDKIIELGAKSPLRLTNYEREKKKFNLSENPMFRIMQFMGTMFSPYQLHVTDHNPLSPLVEELFDFRALKRSKKHKLFLCATQISTGKLKIFQGQELSAKAVLASACVPNLFQAVEVDGEHYWDGGFIGNPAIYPIIYSCESPDILIIQIRRVHDSTVPKTIHEIQNRLGEITQNSCLTREMRMISFLTKLIDDGIVEKDKLKRLYMHMIRDDEFFSSIDRASAFCTDPTFIKHLHDAGYKAGKKWLKKNFDKIGVETTAELEKDFV